MRRFLFFCLTPAVFFSPCNLFSQNSANLKLVAHLNPLPPASNWQFSEVAGAGDLAVIGGFQSGNSNVWIYDLADRANPRLLSAIPINTRSWDVQVHGRYLFIGLSGRMEWHDILNPAQPKLVKRFTPDPPINPHTFFVAGNTLYIADYAAFPYGIRIFDITDKKNPQELAEISDPNWSIHDMTVIHKRLYGAWISGLGGLLVADVSNPGQPVELTRLNYPNAATHNAWPTEDEQFILTTDEVSFTRNNLKIWDARTPGQLSQTDEYEVRNASSPIHNVYVRGRYAYMSYYCEGLRIVDIADPFNHQEVAFYDFNDSVSCEGFNSNWGVYPFSKLIYASDMQNGLYVLEFADHPAANLSGEVVDALTNAPVAGAMVYFRDEYPTSRTNVSGSFEIPWFKKDKVTLVAEAAGYFADTTTATTNPAQATFVSIRLKPLTTGIESSNDETVREFTLLPTYPNPLAPAAAISRTATQITFRLPHAENVQIDVYNLFGQRVRELLKASRPAGEHRVLWNGRDNADQQVAAGIYLLQMRAGEFAATRKITLIQ